MLVEARTSLISGATIVTGTILGYSAMAGTVGGGCGSIAFSYQKSGEWNEQDQQDQEWDASENICDHIQDLI